VRGNVTNFRLTDNLAKRAGKVVRGSQFRRVAQMVNFAVEEYLNLEEIRQQYHKWHLMSENAQFKKIRSLESKIHSLEREIKELTLKNSMLLSKLSL